MCVCVRLSITYVLSNLITVNYGVWEYEPEAFGNY